MNKRPDANWIHAADAAVDGLLEGHASAPRLAAALRQMRPELAHGLDAGVLRLAPANLPERGERDLGRLGEGLDL